MADPLESEIKKYEEELPNLVQNEGKFVLIAGQEVVGVYDTYADALKVGYEKQGLKPFLVKQIKQIEPIHFFTRDIKVTCPI